MIDQQVVSKVVNEGNIDEFHRRGVRTFHFVDDYQEVWDWLNQQVSMHGAVPSERQFKKKWGDISIEDTSNESYSALTSELLDQYRRKVLAEALADATTALNDDDTQKALGAIIEAHTKASASTTVLRDVDLNADWAERWAEYKRRMEHGIEIGYPSGFPSLDHYIGGWREENFILYVGEPKRGKSLFSLIAAKAANEQKNASVLYVSFEMSAAEQAERYDAIVAGINFNHFRNGQLTKRELERIRDKSRLREHMPPLILAEDKSRMTTVSAIRAKAIEHCPDIIVIDGMYMMQDENNEPDERKALTNITRSVKRLAQELRIPIIGTTQVLPGKVGNKARKIEAHAIGYTSSFIQDADVIIGCELDSEVPNQSILRIVEARNAPKGAYVKVTWNWDSMEFGEAGAGDESDEPDYEDYGEFS